MGMDTENILKNGIVGLAFSTGKTHINSNNATSTDTDVNSYQLTLYTDYDLGQGYYIDGMAGYAINNNTTLRHDVGGTPNLNAHGDFNSQQFAARGETGRAYRLGNATFTPMALVNWVYYSADDYTETGAGGADLKVSTRNINQIDAGVGGKLGWTFRNQNGTRLMPELHAAYRRELTNDRLETSSIFTGGGSTFLGEGPTPARNKYNLGAQIKYYSTDNVELTASYDFDLKQDYAAHAAFLRAGYKF
jgi:outer membrane autotransporter protein